MYPASSEGLNRETSEAVYFFTAAFYALDNFSAHAISLWGHEFPTAEHAFQWKKFSVVEPDIAMMIYEAKSPHAVKEISDAHKAKQPLSWKNEKITVMEEILRAKYSQHADVQDVLKKTGNREIVENSPVDSFWGAGPDGAGENILGKLWVKIREDKNLIH